MIIAKNIRYLRKKAGMSQEELSEALGYGSFTTIQKWESGISTPPLRNFIKMAEIFNVDLYDFAYRDLTILNTHNISLRKLRAVPVYSKLPSQIEGYIMVNEDDMPAGADFFALRIHGSSMAPEYRDNDIVLFERTEFCEDADDCVVSLNGGDATFKRIRHYEWGLSLQALNDQYESIRIRNTDDSLGLTILGIARAIRRKVGD